MLYLVLSLVVALTFSSCSEPFCVRGKGEVVTETRDLPAFEEVVLKGSFDVVLEEGQESKIIISAQENILSELSTQVRSDGRLVVDYDRCVNHTKKVTLRITSPSYKGIVLDGSGKVESVGTLQGQNLNIALNGSGDFDIDLRLEGELDANINGSGDMNFCGNTNTARYFINGSGNIKAFCLEAQEVRATISGSGNIEVWATEALSANITGSGDIYYKGNPATFSSNVSGSGKVHKVE
ncbi:head GIN domain-containing protein [Hugenholtzia roseola]|uniref:head GIN domain-containing protein n=1 Tax=Hugenholtzia roseola TaxID=1002 RepID=UPI001376EDD0|nr:head GIN domain-containing protein [Hugenholtzia roseola]